MPGVQLYLSLACDFLTLIALWQSGTGVLDMGCAAQGCLTMDKLCITSLRVLLHVCNEFTSSEGMGE